MEQLFAGLAVQPAAAGVSSRLTERGVEALAEEVSRAPSPSDSLQDSGVDESRQSGPEFRWYGQFSMNEIEDQQLVRVEGHLRLAPHALQKPHKARISNLAV